ncbi:MAG TPA: hypothetical protein EYN92_07130 [Dehalococcoidia bacterium]|nr:hypothetical protein [Dehalococcoidia bacterium]
MKITDITVNRIRAPQGNNARSFVGRPGRLLLQVHTNEGITGISEAGRNLKVMPMSIYLTGTMVMCYK